jgi:hypothetical protein
VTAYSNTLIFQLQFLFIYPPNFVCGGIIKIAIEISEYLSKLSQLKIKIAIEISEYSINKNKNIN